MGLNRSAIKLVAETVRDLKPGGRALILGKQDIWGTEPEILRWLEESGITPVTCEVELSLKEEFRRLGFIQDTSLFRSMGFREVVNLDVSAYEGASVIHDLNRALPDELLEKTGCFDLILDAGCLEHVFNVPQALGNLYRLTAPGGVVIHIAPSSNYVDHGFYMFSPTLFHDYYSANRWQMVSHYFFQHGPNYQARWKIYRYRPGALTAFAFSGGLNRAMCGIYAAARKQPGATGDAPVQQGMFVAAWAERGGAAVSDQVGAAGTDQAAYSKTIDSLFDDCGDEVENPGRGRAVSGALQESLTSLQWCLMEGTGKKLLFKSSGACLNRFVRHFAISFELPQGRRDLAGSG